MRIKNILVIVILLFIAYLAINCPVRTIINTKSARGSVKNSLVNIKASALYDKNTNKVDLSMDRTILDGHNYEIYLGVGKSDNVNEWTKDVEEWSCICANCEGDLSYELVNGESAGGDGNDSGDSKSFKEAVLCGNLGMHILVDTNDDGILDSDVIIPVNLKGLEDVLASDGLYSDKIEIDWSPNSCAVGGYSLYRSENPDINKFSESNKIADLTNDFFTDRTASIGGKNPEIGGDPDNFFKDYYYAVKYISSCGVKSDFSNCDLGYLKRPEGPTLTASDSTSQKKIDMSWTNIEGVTKWRLQRRDVYIKDDKEYPVVEWRTLKEVGSQNYEDLGNPSNVMYSENSIMLNGYKIRYYYKVRGIEGTATDWSNIDSGSILDNSLTINSPVRNSNENKVTINWSNGNGLVNNYYQLQRKISGGYGVIHNGDTTSYIDSSISPDVNYTYRVTPRIDYVWGVSSNEVEYTLIFEEWIPNISISVITGNSMKISWDGIPTSEKYFLDRTPLDETFEYTHPTTRIEDSSTGINFDTIYSYKLRGYKEPNRYTRYSGTVMGKVNP